MIRVGMIGFGYWGPNLVRNFWTCPRSEVACIADVDDDKLKDCARLYPGTRTTNDWHDVVNDDAIDAVAVATPVSTHHEIALAALRNGKHVLVEKPLADSSQAARELVDEATKQDRVLMVDHTYNYTGAVHKIRKLIDDGELGPIYYFDSTRINLGLFQHDVNVVWDLAVHDFAILDLLVDAKPSAVSATGLSHVVDDLQDIGYITLFFDNKTIAHINVSWLAPVKIRRTIIGGTKKMVVYDDLDMDQQVKVYDKGIDLADSKEQIYEMLVSYRIGDIWTPNVDLTEPLANAVNHFADCIEQGKPASTDGAMGLRVVQVCEAATESMAQQGRPVTIGDTGSSESSARN